MRGTPTLKNFLKNFIKGVAIIYTVCYNVFRKKKKNNLKGEMKMKLKGNQLLMFRLLKERAVNNEASISRGEIAKEINCSKRTVSYSMRLLEKLGYIETVSGMEY